MDFNTLSEFIKQLNYFIFFFFPDDRPFNTFENRLNNHDLCAGSAMTWNPASRHWVFTQFKNKHITWLNCLFPPSKNLVQFNDWPPPCRKVVLRFYWYIYKLKFFCLYHCWKVALARVGEKPDIFKGWRGTTTFKCQGQFREMLISSEVKRVVCSPS